MAIVWDNSFRRAFKRLVRKNPQLHDKIFEVLELLDADIFASSLKSHKLRGNLEGLWACWVEYDCLIVFSLAIDFTDLDNVIPDVVWASHQKLTELLDEAGHLTGAPELVVEVLSPGEKQEKRDRELKLKLYSIQGVHEYWIFDRERQKVEIYRRENAVLKLAANLYKDDNLTSPLLPGFSCGVERLFG